VVRGGWAKKMFIIGAVLDGLVAVVMLVPSLQALLVFQVALLVGFALAFRAASER